MRAAPICLHRLIKFEMIIRERGIVRGIQALDGIIAAGFDGRPFAEGFVLESYLYRHRNAVSIRGIVVVDVDVHYVEVSR